jgi:hypothetical protein
MLNYFPHGMPGFHYYESCQGKLWHRQPIRQNCSFLERKDSHPLWGWLGHMSLPAGPFGGITASRMFKLLETYKNLRDTEKLSLMQCKLCHGQTILRGNKAPTPPSPRGRGYWSQKVQGRFSLKNFPQFAHMWPLNRNTAKQYRLEEQGRLAKANALSRGCHRSPETLHSKESLIKFNGQTSRS